MAIGAPLRAITTPKFRYLLAKFGSKMPYRRAAQLLTELLPLPNGGVSHTTVRRHTLLVGERFDQPALDPGEYDWPECQREPAVPADRVTVAIDGTYIRAGLDCWSRQLHVVAGRIDRDGKLGAHFAWVAGESVASCHMKAILEEQGCNPNSMVAVLADGAQFSHRALRSDSAAILGTPKTSGFGAVNLRGRGRKAHTLRDNRNSHQISGLVGYMNRH
jgi:hypothetical protein